MTKEYINKGSAKTKSILFLNDAEKSPCNRAATALCEPHRGQYKPVKS
jgi:hypothetical protein